MSQSARRTGIDHRRARDRVSRKPRFTEDFDIFVEASPENARLVQAALNELASQVAVNIMTSISGMTFEEAWDGRVEGTFGGERAFFIGKAELIRNKETTARPQDLADVDLLRRF